MPTYTMINQDSCIACGVCGEEAPEIFDYDDDGVAYSTLDNNQGTVKVPGKMLEQLENSQEACPTESVIVAEKPIMSGREKI